MPRRPRVLCRLTLRFRFLPIGRARASRCSWHRGMTAPTLAALLREETGCDTGPFDGAICVLCRRLGTGDAVLMQARIDREDREQRRRRERRIPRILARFGDPGAHSAERSRSPRAQLARRGYARAAGQDLLRFGVPRLRASVRPCLIRHALCQRASARLLRPPDGLRLTSLSGGSQQLPHVIRAPLPDRSMKRGQHAALLSSALPPEKARKVGDAAKVDFLCNALDEGSAAFDQPSKLPADVIEAIEWADCRRNQEAPPSRRPLPLPTRDIVRVRAKGVGVPRGHDAPHRGVGRAASQLRSHGIVVRRLRPDCRKGCPRCQWPSAAQSVPPFGPRGRESLGAFPRGAPVREWAPRAACPQSVRRARGRRSSAISRSRESANPGRAKGRRARAHYSQAPSFAPRSLVHPFLARTRSLRRCRQGQQSSQAPRAL